MRHAVIMAGGAGTRLWPLSRKQRPKHFLRLIEGCSLMRMAYERLAGVLPAEQIHVVTSADHLPLVASELPELPPDNLIGEPAVRDTANAIGLAAVLLNRLDPQGTMGVFTADHVIRPQERFRLAVERAFAAAERFGDALVAIGVRPTSAHTGFGYIQTGRPLAEGLFAAEGFKEKPDLQAARQYLAGGRHLWNSGMFAWRLEAILEQLRRHLPGNHGPLLRVGRASAAQRGRILEEIYPTLPKISIDYGVMEKAETVLVAEMDCEWIDVGAWTALAEVLEPTADGHVQTQARVLHVGSKNTIVVGEQDHLIATIGLQDCVIVHAPDATLICHKDHVQKIKDLVARLDEEYL
jgi:mannose-1-phosphate guanylyltransferase